MSSRKVPRKNVTKVVSDIRAPREHFPNIDNESKDGENRQEERVGWRRNDGLGAIQKRRNRLTFKNVAGVAGLLFIIVGALSVWGLNSLSIFDIPPLPALEGEQSETEFLNLSFSDIVGNKGFANMIRAAKLFLGDSESREALTRLGESLSVLRAEISEVELSLPGFIFGQSNEFRNNLSDINNILISASEDLELVASNSDSEGILSVFGDYISLRSELETWRSAIVAFLELIDSPRSQHLIVFFGNSSELRPGWGFTGSFADIELGGGEVRNISIHDINEVDRTVETLIVPPKPLQTVASRFRVADANWFFDHPSSAKKALALMERSDMYAGKSIAGSIAVSPAIVEDLLKLSGPIELEDGLTISSKDFLRQIQGEVQNARAESSDSPKDILGKTALRVLEKLAGASPDARGDMFEILLSGATQKDMILFFRDPRLSRIVARLGMDGAVYQIPENTKADYLAVVSANLASGKSDLVMEQSVRLESRLEESGEVVSHLEVLRKHHGENEKDWWYKTANDSYLKVFTPKGSRLTFAGGGEERNISPKASYGTEYVDDPDIAILEDNENKTFDFPEIVKGLESGKTTFSTWVKTPAGGSDKLVLDYSRRLSGAFIDGDRYTFVLETQAGAKSSYYIRLTAPVGYIWAETGLPAYEYQSNDPPGRIVLNLTLQES